MDHVDRLNSQAQAQAQDLCLGLPLHLPPTSPQPSSSDPLWQVRRAQVLVIQNGRGLHCCACLGARAHVCLSASANTIRDGTGAAASADALSFASYVRSTRP